MTMSIAKRGNPRASGPLTMETLVVTMSQTDRSLVRRMNIQTDAIIGNQCGERSTDVFDFDGHRMLYLNTDERGVGNNRNLVLSHANADLCILADDDLTFVDGYPSLVRRAFSEVPQADVIVFNLLEKVPTRKANRAFRRVGWLGYGKYGAPRLVLRREAVQRHGLRFSLEFGGGARYGAGEDTIFLRDCLKAGLKVYTAPYALAEIDQDASSTHFTGFDEKFFRDKGAAYVALHPTMHPFFEFVYVLRHRREHRASLSFIQALRYMRVGGKNYKRLHGGSA